MPFIGVKDPFAGGLPGKILGWEQMVLVFISQTPSQNDLFRTGFTRVHKQLKEL
jgi:hypothetical protein